MAFYPDELSPIDRIHSFGNSNELLDINPIKTRRQWKSMVLGKKEMGLSNFATIAEEKEEEIIGDEDENGQSNQESHELSKLVAGVVANKKITFPKPRKYINSRISDLKEEGKSNAGGGSFPLPSGTLADDVAVEVAEKSNVTEQKSGSQKGNRDLRVLHQEQNSVRARKDVRVNYEEAAGESQWTRPTPETVCLSGWPKSTREKVDISKTDAAAKVKADERKNNASGNAKVVGAGIAESKTSRKKAAVSPVKKTGKDWRGKVASDRPSEVSGTDKTKKIDSKSRSKSDKNKSLNMKEVVNVYKNLAYGSEQEIKSFVEKLSFVKDESKTENDKNLLSMMNLKALETKIKNFAKNSGKGQDLGSSTTGKGTKQGKSVRKGRKGHLERLTRQKVVKVPAVSNISYLKSKAGLRVGTPNPLGPPSPSPSPPPTQKKKSFVEEKEPWKYVGMQSILDKTYLVYPAYPPSTSLLKKKGGKKGKNALTKKSGAKQEGKKEKAPDKKNMAAEDKSKSEEKTAKTIKPVSKVKPLQVNIVKGEGGGTRTGNGDPSRGSSHKSCSANVPASASGKNISRSSATTVCKIEFPSREKGSSERPGGRGGSEDVGVGVAREMEDGGDPSLLVYLHGTKAINVKSPYSDRQFSRVKVFRKDARGLPLIKGLARKVFPKSHRKVSVKNVSLPEVLTRLRSLDFLDFDEDIENINEFLCGQGNVSDRIRREEVHQASRKTQSFPGTRNGEQERHPNQSRGRQMELQGNRHHHHHPHNYRRHHKQNQHNHRHVTRYTRYQNQQQQHDSVLSPDYFVDEISKNIEHLQYLPDTEENRNLIGKFFEELDERIEASKEEQLALMPRGPQFDHMCPIPILGY